MYIDSSFLSLFYCIMRTINAFYDSTRKGSSFLCLLSECARVSPHIEEIAIIHFCIKSEGFDIVLKVECRIYRGVRIACFENCSNSCLCGLLNPREDLLPHRGGLRILCMVRMFCEGLNGFHRKKIISCYPIISFSFCQGVFIESMCLITG